MRVLLAVIALFTLAGCGPSDNVNREATQANAEKACEKHGMALGKIQWYLEDISDITCIDPMTQEYKALRILNAKWNPTK